MRLIFIYSEAAIKNKINGLVCVEMGDKLIVTYVPHFQNARNDRFFSFPIDLWHIGNNIRTTRTELDSIYGLLGTRENWRTWKHRNIETHKRRDTLKAQVQHTATQRNATPRIRRTNLRRISIGRSAKEPYKTQNLKPSSRHFRSRDVHSSSVHPFIQSLHYVPHRRSSYSAVY